MHSGADYTTGEMNGSSMPLGPVRDIVIFLVSAMGTGLAYWRLSYKIGQARGADVEKIKSLTLAIARMNKEQDRHANQFLRVFQAIEELRRRTGNGSKEWYDLTGG